VTSTIPADLLELKARFETWRTNRKYVREPRSPKPSTNKSSQVRRSGDETSA
jgi:hypothetical protein